MQRFTRKQRLQVILTVANVARLDSFTFGQRLLLLSDTCQSMGASLGFDAHGFYLYNNASPRRREIARFDILCNLLSTSLQLKTRKETP